MPYDVSDAFNSMSLGSPMHMSLERSPMSLGSPMRMSLERSPMESMLPVAESYIRMCQDYDNRFPRPDNMSFVGLPAPSPERPFMLSFAAGTKQKWSRWHMS